MPVGWYGPFEDELPRLVKVGRPDRGDRAKVKAGRKASRAARRR